MSVDTVRIGLIGCGFIGRFHAANLKHLARLQHGVDYAAVCDRDIERARAFAQIAGCSMVTADPREIIESAEIDAVYVCTETSEHVELVLAAARAGKHVFCEKPLAKSYTDARRMLTAVEDAGVVHQVGLVLRFSPVYRVLEDLCGQADLGPLLAVQMRDDQFFPNRGHYASAWRSDVERAGGGTLIEHSIHDVDLLARLCGPITSTDCRTRVTSGHQGVEDVASVAFEHEGGHVSQLLSVWHALDDRPSTRRLEVFFEGGWFMTEDDYFGAVTCQGRSGEPQTLSSDEVLARFLSLEGLEPDQHDLKTISGLSDRRFIDAIRNGRPAVPGFQKAVSAHRVVDACYLSARETRRVAVAEIV